MRSRNRHPRGSSRGEMAVAQWSSESRYIARSGPGASLSTTGLSDSELAYSRKNWSEDTMEMALRDVTNGVLGVRRAALEHGLPKSTLSDRVTGRVRPGSTSGPPRYLDEEEEEEVVRWITGCAEIGCAKSVREVRAVVSAVVAKKSGESGPAISVSHGWWDKFRKRHPELVLRTGEAVAYKRAASVNRPTINHYFDLLEATLESNGLLSRPSLIFNADESGIPLSPRPGKRVGIRGMKRVCCVTSGVKTQITVLCCVSAAGSTLPPLVIFQRSNLLKSLTVGEVPGTMYGLNPRSGWIDGDIFREWFLNHFLFYAPAGRPLLLLLDGHSSHYNPGFIREAAGHGVVVFCLPPNTTHVSQPLDSTCFHSLKVFWARACDEYMCQHPGKVVTIYQFSQLFSSAFTMALTPRNVTSSFRATGVFPPDRRAIPIPGEPYASKDSATPTAKVANKHGIQYLPFYTPVKPVLPCPSPSSESLLKELSFDTSLDFSSPQGSSSGDGRILSEEDIPTRESPDIGMQSSELHMISVRSPSHVHVVDPLIQSKLANS